MRASVRIPKLGGGYVLSNLHTVQAGVPREDVVVTYDPDYEYGFCG